MTCRRCAVELCIETYCLNVTLTTYLIIGGRVICLRALRAGAAHQNEAAAILGQESLRAVLGLVSWAVPRVGVSLEGDVLGGKHSREDDGV